MVVWSDAKMTLAPDTVATHFDNVGHDPMSAHESWSWRGALVPLFTAVGL